MPRLSIDIDLTYLVIEQRDVFIKNITQTLSSLAKDITDTCQAITTPIITSRDRQLSKLLVSKNNVVVKIEPNFIFRGSVFGADKKTLCKAAQDQFLQSIKINVLSYADVYAGKICAALNRQHPRDLFDIKILFENSGISDQIRQAFVIYLACNPRPMHELLNPNLIDIQLMFQKEFLGMTLIPTSYQELLNIRKHLIKIINEQLTLEERQFLMSIKIGEPRFDLLNIENISNLPAIQWKIMNIRKLEKNKHQNLTDKLKKVLQL